MARNFGNGYASVISTGPIAGATAVVPTSVAGAPATPFDARIRNSVLTADGLHFVLEEIVSVTDITTGTCTITRATEAIYDGSQSAVNFSGGAAVIEAVLTAGAGGDFGGGGGSLEVKEADGTPDVSGVTQIIVPNGALTDNTGGSVTITTGGGGGGLVLLEQHTASNSATLDFTTCITATYDEYMIELLGIVPATNGAIMTLRCSTDGGANYDTSGIYDYGELHIQWAGSASSYGASNGTSIPIFNDGAGSALLNTATPALVATIRLFDPLNATNYKYLLAQGNGVYTSGNRYQFTSSGVYRSATAVDAIRFLMSSGNIASGTIRVYGIAKV